MSDAPIQCRPIVAIDRALLETMRRGLLRLALTHAAGSVDRARVIALELGAGDAVTACDAAARALSLALDAAHRLQHAGSLRAPFAPEDAGYDANGSTTTEHAR